MNVKTNYLAISYSTSRGAETYGYTIVRLDDRATDKRYKCMGGGYDMHGTCVAQWLASTYQGRLLDAGTAVTGLYGARLAADGLRVQLDGACGLECMIRVAEAIGISLSRNANRKGHTVGFMVTDYGSADAMRAANEGSN